MYAKGTIQKKQNKTKNIDGVNTIYVMKQGTRIQLQLVIKKGLKCSGQCLMLFIKTCMLVTLDRIALILLKKRRNQLSRHSSSSSSYIQNKQTQKKL